MTRVYERIALDCFAFRGLHGCPSACGIALLATPDRRVVVICTELVDNPGTSITNAVELIASEVASRFGLDPSRLVWIEHYPASPTHGEESWDLVTFERMLHDGRTALFAEPSWRPMRAADWQALSLGGSLFFDQ